jgi:integrase
MTNSDTQRRPRYRSANGDLRPYKEANRWVAPRMVDFPDGSRRLIRGTGKTRADAEKRLAEVIDLRLRQAEAIEPTQGAESEGPAPTVLTVEGWTRHWLEAIKRQDIRDSTYEGYLNAIDQWIAPRVGATALSDLTVEDLDRLHAEMMAAGRSRSAWVQVRTVLKQSMDVAVDRGHIAINPTLRAPKPGRPNRSLKHLSLDEARKVVAAADGLTQQVRVFLALSLGLRPGETLALRWQDVELDGNAPTLRIDRTIARRKGRGLVDGPTKTEKSRRTIQMPGALVALLSDLRAEQMNHALLLGQDWTPEWHVLSPGSGMAYDASNDRKRWYRLLERAGVSKVPPHGARHTAASLMIGSGVDIHVISSALGHASISTTADIYGHVPGKSVAAAVAAVVDQLAG